MNLKRHVGHFLVGFLLCTSIILTCAVAGGLLMIAFNILLTAGGKTAAVIGLALICLVLMASKFMWDMRNHTAPWE